jgi:hypothetical protein
MADGRHEAGIHGAEIIIDGVPLGAPPTQVQYPWKAFWRTALQVGPQPAVGLLIILPAILQSILDGFGRDLPPEIYVWLVGFTGSITLVASILSKVMARPDVNEWIRKYAPFFAPEKK